MHQKGNMREEILFNALQDFIVFSEEFLKIKDKSGEIIPFRLKRGQKFLHDRIEAQLKSTGKVRAVLLKGRQGGYSTYVQARYFWKVVTTRGKKAFILTHNSEATKNVFAMTKRFYEKIQDKYSFLIPSASAISAKEMRFDTLDAAYAVATSLNANAGRSQTIQLFHGSEVAFWENADDHSKGCMQAVSDSPATEIILESTANGIGGYFHSMWESASTGSSEYQAIFIPWYWDEDYMMPCPPGQNPELTEYEREIYNTYKNDGLTLEGIYWRRNKIASFGGDENQALEAFKQEYPLNAVEAFRNPVDDRLIDMTRVQAARKNDIESDSPLVIGVDVATSGLDKLSIIRRKGRKAYGLELHNHTPNTMEIVGMVKRIIDTERPAKVCIDVIGVGAAVYDRLLELGYTCVEAVNVANRAHEPNKFANRRAELYCDLRDWFMQDLPVQIPDSDVLAGNLTCFGFKFRSNGQMLIESKDELKKRGLKSPDAGDALMLTFAVGFYTEGSSNFYNPVPQNYAGMLT